MHLRKTPPMTCPSFLEGSPRLCQAMVQDGRNPDLRVLRGAFRGSVLVQRCRLMDCFMRVFHAGRSDLPFPELGV